MKILKAKNEADGIHIETELDGELFIRKFDKNCSADDIKNELLQSEENIKNEKLKKEEYLNSVKLDNQADETISQLIS